jgi:hypothetical protein
VRGLTRMQRQRVAAEWRRAAEWEEAQATEAERTFAGAPWWTAAASIAPNARARAVEARAIAERLEAETGP